MKNNDIKFNQLKNMKTVHLKWFYKPQQLALLIFISIGLYNATPSFAQKDVKQATSKKVLPPKEDLQTAAITGNIAAVKQHIAAGSNLNVKEQMGGSTPLITATLFGKVEVAKALIDAGANLNVKNNDGSTALHVAAFFCRPEVVKMLLAKRVDRSIKNNYGATAYESLLPPFKDVKSIYEMMGKMLSPMGLKLDYAYIEATRPKIAAMLK